MKDFWTIPLARELDVCRTSTIYYTFYFVSTVFYYVFKSIGTLTGSNFLSLEKILLELTER